MATKDQERAALELIRRTVESLGEDSYVGRALDGCLDLAQENIDKDWGLSMLERAEKAEQELLQVKAYWGLHDQQTSEQIRDLNAEIRWLEVRLDRMPDRDQLLKASVLINRLRTDAMMGQDKCERRILEKIRNQQMGDMEILFEEYRAWCKRYDECSESIQVLQRAAQPEDGEECDGQV